MDLGVGKDQRKDMFDVFQEYLTAMLADRNLFKRSVSTSMPCMCNHLFGLVIGNIMAHLIKVATMKAY